MSSALRILSKRTLRPAMMRAPQMQKRTIVESLNKKANAVPGKQVHFQQNPHLHGADNPTYLKGKGDGFINAVSAVVFVTASTLLFRGHWKMAHGSK